LVWVDVSLSPDCLTTCQGAFHSTQRLCYCGDDNTEDLFFGFTVYYSLRRLDLHLFSDLSLCLSVCLSFFLWLSHSLSHIHTLSHTYTHSLALSLSKSQANTLRGRYGLLWRGHHAERDDALCPRSRGWRCRRHGPLLGACRPASRWTGTGTGCWGRRGCPTTLISSPMNNCLTDSTDHRPPEALNGAIFRYYSNTLCP